MRAAAYLACLVVGVSAHADERTVGDMFRAVAPRDFVVAFVGHCVHNPGRLDKVGAAAVALGYADTPEPFWTMFAPQGGDALYHSWFVVEGEGSPYMLGISEAPLDGETYQICAVSNPFLGADVALKELGLLMELGSVVSDETIAGQRTRVWITPDVLEGAFITSNDIGGMGYEGVTLAPAAPKQY